MVWLFLNSFEGTRGLQALRRWQCGCTIPSPAELSVSQVRENRRHCGNMQSAEVYRTDGRGFIKSIKA